MTKPIKVTFPPPKRRSPDRVKVAITNAVRAAKSVRRAWLDSVRWREPGTNGKTDPGGYFLLPGDGERIARAADYVAGEFAAIAAKHRGTP